MQEDNITVRLKFLIQELGITNSVFAENCGISRATLSQLLTGRNKKISDIIIGKIHAAYPSLSILWLIFNEGEMWTGNPPVNSKSDNTNQVSNPILKDEHKDVDFENTAFSSPDGSNAQNNPSEISDFPTSMQSCSKKSKENGLNSNENTPQPAQSKVINGCINSADFFNEIENLRKKARKVVQITVYYDDSTFESFYPNQ